MTNKKKQIKPGTMLDYDVVRIVCISDNTYQVRRCVWGGYFIKGDVHSMTTEEQKEFEEKQEKEPPRWSVIADNIIGLKKAKKKAREHLEFYYFSDEYTLKFEFKYYHKNLNKKERHYERLNVVG